MNEKYSPPVSALLKYKDCISESSWPDYAAEFGLTKEDVPQLIQMIKDDDLWNADPEGLEVWAPVHAWRALGQLGAAEATIPLLQRLNNPDDLWADGEMLEVMKMIGKRAIPGMMTYISDSSNNEYGRGRAVEYMPVIVDADPEKREEAIIFLTSQLNNYMDNGAFLNGHLIEALCRLDAKDAVHLMEMAYRVAKVYSWVVHWDRIMAFKESHAAQ